MDDGSQFTSTGNGKTNLNNRQAMNIQDLPTPKGNISRAELSMYSCHSADNRSGHHGEGIHAQGDLKGSGFPIAYVFAQKFRFRQVRGTSESVNYHSFLTDGTYVWSNNYYKPYPANGGKWTIIIRKNK